MTPYDGGPIADNDEMDKLLSMLRADMNVQLREDQQPSALTQTPIRLASNSTSGSGGGVGGVGAEPPPPDAGSVDYGGGGDDSAPPQIRLPPGMKATGPMSDVTVDTTAPVEGDYGGGRDEITEANIKLPPGMKPVGKLMDVKAESAGPSPDEGSYSEIAQRALLRMREGFESTGKTLDSMAGVSGKPLPGVSDVPQAEYEKPLSWDDSIGLMAKKFAFGAMSSGGQIGGATMGGAAGSAIGPWGTVGGAALGAALGTAFQEFGPIYANERAKTPNDPDGAFERAWQLTGVSSGAGALSQALFMVPGTKTLLKSMVGAANPSRLAQAATTAGIQTVGQPGIAVGAKVASNVIEDKPLSEDLADAVLGGFVNTAVAGVGHLGAKGAATAIDAARGRRTAPPPPPAPGVSTRQPPPETSGGVPDTTNTTLSDPAVRAAASEAVNPRVAPDDLEQAINQATGETPTPPTAPPAAEEPTTKIETITSPSPDELERMRQEAGAQPAAEPTGAVPDSVLSAIGDMRPTNENAIPLHGFSPDEARALEAAGLVKEYTTEGGEKYQGVDNETLWQMRTKRATEIARENAPKPADTTTEVTPPTAEGEKVPEAPVAEAPVAEAPAPAKPQPRLRKKAAPAPAIEEEAAATPGSDVEVQAAVDRIHERVQAEIAGETPEVGTQKVAPKTAAAGEGEAARRAQPTTLDETTPVEAAPTVPAADENQYTARAREIFTEEGKLPVSRIIKEFDVGYAEAQKIRAEVLGEKATPREKVTLRRREVAAETEATTPPVTKAEQNIAEIRAKAEAAAAERKARQAQGVEGEAAPEPATQPAAPVVSLVAKGAGKEARAREANRPGKLPAPPREGDLAESRSKTTTDTNLKRRDALHDLLKGDKDVDQMLATVPERKPGTRGRPQANTWRSFLDERIARAEEHEAADQALVDQMRAAIKGGKLSQDRLERLSQELSAKLDAQKAARGEYAERERENLAKLRELRDQLPGAKPSRRTLKAREPTAQEKEESVARSEEYSGNLKNSLASKTIDERLKEADSKGGEHSLRTMLEDIAEDKSLHVMAPDAAAYAKHLLERMKADDDVPVSTPDAIARGTGEPGWARQAEPALYDPLNDIVSMKHGTNLSPVELTLHESTHVVTAHYLDHLADKVARGEKLTREEQRHHDAVQAIKNEFRRLLDKADLLPVERERLTYALEAGGDASAAKPGHELFSAIFTTPETKAVLGREMASPGFKNTMKALGFGNIKTVWQGFKALVKSIVGFKEGSVLDHVLNPATDILEAGARHRARVLSGEVAPPRSYGLLGAREPAGRLPTDGVPGQRARDMLRPFGQSFDRPLSFPGRPLGAPPDIPGATRRWYEGIKPALARTQARVTAPVTFTRTLAQYNRDVLPQGPAIARAMARATGSTNDYYHAWGDRVQNWVRELKASDRLGALMRDATLNRTHLGNDINDFHARNSHLNDEQMKVAEGLKERFDAMTPREQQLYQEIRDYHRQAYETQRQLTYEDLMRKAMPDATDAQITRFGEKMKTLRGIREVIANIDNDPNAAQLSERLQNSRALLRDIARVQELGFIRGDYFPLRRYGDFVLTYGDPHERTGDNAFGTEYFERSNQAVARRRELLAQNPDMRVSNVLSRRQNLKSSEFVPESVMADVVRAMAKRGAKPEQIDLAKDAFTYAMIRRAANSDSALRRNYTRGASSDMAQALWGNFFADGSRIGFLKRRAEEAGAFAAARRHVDAMERAHAAPGTPNEIAAAQKSVDDLIAQGAPRADIEHAIQQLVWTQHPPTSAQRIRARETLNSFEARRGPADGDGSSALTGRVVGAFTKASFLYHLARPAHLALQVAESHANAQSYLGAEFGHARTAAALARALYQATPGAFAKERGFSNVVRAIKGDMKLSQWRMDDALFERFRKGGADPDEMRILQNELNEWGLINSTQVREIQALSGRRHFDFGDPGHQHPWMHVGDNMMNLWAVGEHTVDATMRAVIAKAGFDLARRAGQSPEQAARTAADLSYQAMPLYAPWNRPPIISGRSGIKGGYLPAAMQYKQYGMHMYGNMAALVSNIGDPATRTRALTALAGLYATHSLLSGPISNMFGVPLNAALGAWDLLNGEKKPYDWETSLRRWMTETMGDSPLGQAGAAFASGGLPGLAGFAQQRSFKLSNMVDVPELRSFDATGMGQWILQAMTGASGSVAGQLLEGFHELFAGNYFNAAKKLLPRVIGDPLQAYDLATEGVVDKRGRFVASDDIPWWEIAGKAIGLNPNTPTLARQQRHAMEDLQDRAQYHRQQAIDRYVNSGGTDRSRVIEYLQNERYRNISKITADDLRNAMNKEKEHRRHPETLGKTLPQSPAAKREYLDEARFY